MALHQVSGRWRLGFLLALTTAGLWATLPLALKVALEAVDPWTLTWFRFSGAAVLMAVWLGRPGGLRGFDGLSAARWRLLVLAALMLTANYVLYVLGLHATTPANAQVLIQLSSVLLALGGIVVFRERFLPGQWLGLGALTAGLLLFFSDQFGAHERVAYGVGSLMIVVAAATWAAYALAQKQLLVSLRPTAVMGFIYWTAAVILWPVADPTQLLRLDALHTAAAIYCALNTLGAYGAFSEALEHWEASRVGAVLALTPLMTLGFANLVAWRLPGLLAPEHIAPLGYAGAGLVVSGSIAVSLLRRRPDRSDSAADKPTA